MSKKNDKWAVWFVSAALLLVVGAAQAANQGNDVICHKGTTIVVSVNAIPSHLTHGDYMGECVDSCVLECGMSMDAWVICSDGVAYDSGCAAECNGAIGCVWIVTCGPVFTPMICEGGATYPNDCYASNSGDFCRAINELDCAACPTDVSSPLVCSDGTAYNNSCEAYCAGATYCWLDDRAVCAAWCPPEVAPVVCPDGATYSNPCLAACARPDALTCSFISQ